MSLEKDLGRIATALERLAAAAEAKGNPVISVPATPGPVATPPPVQTAPPVATPPPVAQTPPPPPAQTVEMTADELNQFLVTQAGRLGGPDKIFAVLREAFGAASISNVQPAQYAQLKAAVEALS